MAWQTQQQLVCFIIWLPPEGHVSVEEQRGANDEPGAQTSSPLSFYPCPASVSLHGVSSKYQIQLSKQLGIWFL